MTRLLLSQREGRIFGTPISSVPLSQTQQERLNNHLQGLQIQLKQHCLNSEEVTLLCIIHQWREFLFKFAYSTLLVSSLYSVQNSHTLSIYFYFYKVAAAAAAAKLLQSCLTLCDPIDGSPPGSPVPGILQARTLEWVAISFSNA